MRNKTKTQETKAALDPPDANVAFYMLASYMPLWSIVHSLVSLTMTEQSIWDIEKVNMSYI
jgi:hypothetical protein